MKEELEKKLFEKYPKIFRQKDLSMQETAMCWGIETGPGWEWLIDNLCGCIQNYLDGNDHLKIPQVEAMQVKEKFGGLRFYTNISPDPIDGMIWFAQFLSRRICEDCGATENVTVNDVGWIYTLCSRCRKFREKQTKWPRRWWSDARGSILRRFYQKVMVRVGLSKENGS